MKIVLDTNVLVAGLLSPFGPCGDIVRMVSSGTLALCFDARILSEYSEVLKRPKFRFAVDEVDALIDFISFNGQTVAPSPLSKPLPDPDDEPFLEVAIAGHVACLVTGNRVHFPAGQRQGVKILSPREFLTRYRTLLKGTR
ncbi:MAG TPA: putative toxin-antitoxin system toxin component, PIN family [Candidatus Methylomirabilis sp.]|nr:putative toxin-antitoxin system toxin component, PIN family [Candidatus Methylomirabilis sp.]